MPHKIQMGKENYGQGEKLIDYSYYEKKMLSNCTCVSLRIYGLIIIARTSVVPTINGHGSKSFTYINSLHLHSISEVCDIISIL